MTDELDVAYEYYQARKYQKALRKFREVAESDPGNTVAHLGLAQSLLMLNRLEEASQEGQRALDLESRSAKPYAVLAYIYLKRGQIDHAESMAKKALELDPDWAEPHVIMGRIYFKQEKDPEAEACFRLVSELDPESDSPHTFFGGLRQSQGRFKEAIEEFKIAYAKSPSFVTVFPIIAVHVARYKLHIWLLPILMIVMFVFRSPLTIFAAFVFVGFGGCTALYQFQIGRRSEGLGLGISEAILLLAYICRQLFIKI